MAIDRTLATEIAKLVSIGDKVNFVSTQNKHDKKTLTDERNLLTQAVKNNLLEVLIAIYDTTPNNKRLNGFPFAVSKQGSKYFVTSIKDAKTEEAKIKITKSLFTVSDSVSGKTTQIELQGVITEETTEVKSMKQQVEEALRTAGSDDTKLIKLIKTIADSN